MRSPDGANPACKNCRRELQIRKRDDACVNSASNPRSETLYVMRNPLLPDMVKIGKAADVAKRAKELGSSQPFTIEICFQYEGYGVLEYIIHDRLREHRVLGGTGREWFAVQAELADGIIRGAIAEWKLAQL